MHCSAQLGLCGTAALTFPVVSRSAKWEGIANRRPSPVHLLTITLVQARGRVFVFVFNPPENNTTRLSGAIGVNTVTICNRKDSNAVPFTINP
jgi:hypothetical protein